MHFRIEQRYNAPIEQVAAAYRSPELLAQLAKLPKLGGAELLDQTVTDGTLHQRVRYRFTGDLNSAVTAVVDPEMLTWVEESTTAEGATLTEWRIVPDHYGSRLTCGGTFRLIDGKDGTTVRVTEADIKVHFPLVGGRVEKAIVSGLVEHAEAEHEAVAAFLAGAE